jgi:hypothetical protein
MSPPRTGLRSSLSPHNSSAYGKTRHRPHLTLGSSIESHRRSVTPRTRWPPRPGWARVPPWPWPVPPVISVALHRPLRVPRWPWPLPRSRRRMLRLHRDGLLGRPVMLLGTQNVLRTHSNVLRTVHGALQGADHKAQTPSVYSSLPIPLPRYRTI